MIASKSPLILKEFTILNTDCEVIPFSSPDFDFITEQISYPIDLDFGIQENEEEGVTAIFIKTEINSERRPGYHIFSEGMGLFTFDDINNLSSEDKQGLIQYSAINICITNLRAYIANITAYYPFGKFNFSAIDMTDLLRQKMNLSEAKAD